jgi:hypothetical protein
MCSSIALHSAQSANGGILRPFHTEQIEGRRTATDVLFDYITFRSGQYQSYSSNRVNKHYRETHILITFP